MEKTKAIISKFKNLLRPYYHHGLMATSFIKIRLLGTTASRLEIGSGPAKREGWLTLDMSSGADVFWDLRRRLPFDDGCFDQVYCSHVLEHFSFNELKLLLLEVRRVLRRGGEFLITVPDASLYVDAYLGRRSGGELMKYAPAVCSGKPMDILNYIFYMDGHHKFMFDNESLAFHCEGAGFVECAVRPFDENLDMPARDYESLYMRCCKQ